LNDWLQKESRNDWRIGEEAIEFEALIEELNLPEKEDKDKKLSRLGQLVEAADYFSKMELPYEPSGTDYSIPWYA
jgi:hypothetical protein